MARQAEIDVRFSPCTWKQIYCQNGRHLFRRLNLVCLWEQVCQRLALLYIIPAVKMCQIAIASTLSVHSGNRSTATYSRERRHALNLIRFTNHAVQVRYSLGIPSVISSSLYGIFSSLRSVLYSLTIQHTISRIKRNSSSSAVFAASEL